MTDEPVINVEYSTVFLKSVKQLRKKYPRIQKDVNPLITQLQNGETPGDQLQSTGHTVYKVRLPNRDAKRGKSGGYRVIYYVRTETQIILLNIYSKSQVSDVRPEQIQDIIGELSQDDEE